MVYLWARNLIRIGKSLSCPYFWWVNLYKCYITEGDLKELLFSISPLLSSLSIRVSASTSTGLDDGDDDNFGSDNGEKYSMTYVTWSIPCKILTVWMDFLCYLNWSIPMHRLLTPTHSLCSLVNLNKVNVRISLLIMQIKIAHTEH